LPKKSEVTWYLDSGCTNHIVNDDKYFDKFITLKNPANVKIDDGEYFKQQKLVV